MICLVCGAEAKHCAPLTFCDKCKDSKEASRIRKDYKTWIRRHSTIIP